MLFIVLVVLFLYSRQNSDVLRITKPGYKDLWTKYKPKIYQLKKLAVQQLGIASRLQDCLPTCACRTLICHSRKLKRDLYFSEIVCIPRLNDHMYDRVLSMNMNVHL